MEDLNRELAVYVLVRTDLPSMNAGKAMAQVHHAGVQMMAQYGQRLKTQDYLADGVAQGAIYFNTTIVLGATLDDIIQRGQMAGAAGEHVVLFNTVTDPSYPFFVENTEVADLIPEHVAKGVKLMPDGRVLMTREEITCAWFLGSRTSPEFTKLFENLTLHP